MTIHISKKTLFISLMLLVVMGLYYAYNEYKRRERADCYAWLLREENLDTILAPGDKCYQSQLDTRELIDDYQPENK